MNIWRISCVLFDILIFSVVFQGVIRCQTTVLQGIEYRQISQFEAGFQVTDMKMNLNGTKIIFSAEVPPAVKVFTMDADGTGLKEIFSTNLTGVYISVDISADGDTVIWCGCRAIFDC